MKKILFLLCICFVCMNAVKAQSAVYICATNGSIGYSYGGSASGLDQVELEMMALDECRKNGGVSCELLYYIEKNGRYVALMVGHGNGTYDTTLATSAVSLQEAKDAAWTNYKNSGYANIDYARMVTWYIPQ